MKAELIAPVKCPKCPFALYRKDSFVVCENPNCELYLKKFTVPSVEISAVENE